MLSSQICFSNVKCVALELFRRRCNKVGYSSDRDGSVSISCAATALGSMSGLRGLELGGCRKGEAFLREMQEKEERGQILVTRDILIRWWETIFLSDSARHCPPEGLGALPCWRLSAPLIMILSNLMQLQVWLCFELQNVQMTSRGPIQLKALYDFDWSSRWVSTFLGWFKSVCNEAYIVTSFLLLKARSP